MVPIVNGLEKEYGDRITFRRVNILNPANTPVMEQYGFTSTPELYLVGEQGQVIKFWDEIDSAEDLRQVLDEALANTGR